MKLFEDATSGEGSYKEISTVTKDEAEVVITDLIKEVVDRNILASIQPAINVQNLITIVDGEVGVGKSYTLKSYIRNNPECRLLVFLERKWAVQEYAAELGGVAIFSGKGRPPIGVQLGNALGNDATVVIMTHSALKDMLENYKHLHVIEHFDLIAVDETFTSLSVYANDYDSFADIIGTLFLGGTAKTGELSRIITEATTKLLRTSKNQVELFKLLMIRKPWLKRS